MDELRYPVGKFTFPENHNKSLRRQWIDAMAELPAGLCRAVDGLSDARLDTPYRPGGWTIRQLVHHVADSHLNAYTRFKFGLTEVRPTIKTYEQDDWAAEPDAQKAPVQVSLDLLHALHKRWVWRLREISESAWKRTITHPDFGEISLVALLALYAWHGRHHTAHVTGWRAREDV